MKNMKWNVFRKFFALNIHGNNLLSPGAGQWMFIARIIVLIMATVEALSWGYLGSLLGVGPRKYVMACMVGLFIFLVVWMVDITLMTLDRYRRYYHRRIFQLEEQEEGKRTSMLLSFVREHDIQISIVFRILMVAMSIVVTAPFLKQLIFQRDISMAIEKDKERIIAVKRDSLARLYDVRIARLESEIDSIEAAHVQEVAGKGPSNRPGNGPTAASILEKIPVRRSNIAQITRDKEAELAAYDRTVVKGDYQLLGQKWNVQIPQNSFAARSEAIKTILDSKDAKLTDTAIKSFLGFLFLALLLLKFFEPRGVRIYLSEALQQSYQTYKNGGYNKWISSEEQPNGDSPMQPFRFEEFMVNVYPRISKKEVEGIEENSQHRQLEKIEKAIMLAERRKAKEEPKIAAAAQTLQDEIKKAEADAASKAAELLDIEKLIRALQQELQYQVAESDAIYHMTHSNGSPAQVSDGPAVVLAHQKIGSLKASQKTVSAKIKQEEARLAEARRQWQLLQAQVVDKKTKLAETERYLTKYDGTVEKLNDEFIALLLQNATAQQPTGKAA